MRARFLKEVFDPAVFGDSDRILQCLNTISSLDWSVASVKIIHLLAKSSLSLWVYFPWKLYASFLTNAPSSPQPFYMSALKIHDAPLAASAALYVDKRGFSANLDQVQSRASSWSSLFSCTKYRMENSTRCTSYSRLYKISTSRHRTWPKSTCYSDSVNRQSLAISRCRSPLETCQRPGRSRKHPLMLSKRHLCTVKWYVGARNGVLLDTYSNSH